MGIHSATMMRKHGYIDILAVSPATLLQLSPESTFFVEYCFSRSFVVEEG